MSLDATLQLNVFDMFDRQPDQNMKLLVIWDDGQMSAPVEIDDGSVYCNDALDDSDREIHFWAYLPLREELYETRDHQPNGRVSP